MKVEEPLQLPDGRHRMGQRHTGGVAALVNLGEVDALATSVTGTLPAFSTQGSRIDVNVSTLGDAKSLQGGTLLVTPLMGADGFEAAANQAERLGAKYGFDAYHLGEPVDVAILQADHPEKMKRVPFNAQNPDGPLEICLCTDCGAVLMLAGP